MPLAHIDPAGVRLEVKTDSVWHPVADFPALVPVAGGMSYQLPMRLEPEHAYRLTVDSLAVTSIYGLHNDTLKIETKVKALEEYANLLFNLDVSDSAFVQLLDGQEEFKRPLQVVAGKADLDNVPPGTYYARVILDRNGNGRWDTGNYLQHIQPEEVYYFPKPLKLRRNWDVDQSWNIYQTPLNLQKPEAIKKNKPEESKNKLEKASKKKRSGTEEDEEEEDEFNSRGFGNSTYSGNKYDDYQRNRRNR